MWQHESVRRCRRCRRRRAAGGGGHTCRALFRRQAVTPASRARARRRRSIPPCAAARRFASKSRLYALQFSTHHQIFTHLLNWIETHFGVIVRKWALNPLTEIASGYLFSVRIANLSMFRKANRFTQPDLHYNINKFNLFVFHQFFLDKFY